MNNYPYFKDYYIAAQETNPFNVLIVSADKRFALTRHLILRPSAAGAESGRRVHRLIFRFLLLPDQIGYEGKLGFKNLHSGHWSGNQVFHALSGRWIFAGCRAVFFTEHKPRLRRNLPDINAYLNLRIRSFVAYVRLENLNTAEFLPTSGFGFTNNNFVAPSYPYAGLKIRLGIYWSFVN